MTAKKWTVSGAVAASTYVGEFFVETGEDAIRMAYGAADVSVCHQCAQNISDPEVAWLVATCGEEEITDRPDLAADLARVTAERDAALAEVEAMRAVVEAARNACAMTMMGFLDDTRAALAALDALRAQRSDTMRE